MGFSLLFGVTTFSFGKTVAPRQPVAATVVANPDSGHVVTLTAYNAVPWQTDSNPLETASGAYSNPEIIAARSADLASELPFGTIIELDGSNVSSNDSCGYNVVAPLIGYRVIEDSMNARYTNRVDVLLGTQENYVKPNGSSMNAAEVLGICKGITVRVVGYVDINHLPKTQAELAALVEKGGGLAFNK
ncbi:MAG: hypothetical protein ACYC1Y_01825 [Minisyncoccota bacterium]